jgi:hypothetical protein
MNISADLEYLDFMCQPDRTDLFLRKNIDDDDNHDEINTVSNGNEEYCQTNEQVENDLSDERANLDEIQSSSKSSTRSLKKKKIFSVKKLIKSSKQKPFFKIDRRVIGNY